MNLCIYHLFYKAFNSSGYIGEICPVCGFYAAENGKYRITILCCVKSKKSIGLI